MSFLVGFYVFVSPDPLVGLRVATWQGNVSWPSAPHPGDSWFHCGDWGGEWFDRVSFKAPTAPGEPGVDVEVKASVEVLAHLVEAHGFTGTHAERRP